MRGASDVPAANHRFRRSFSTARAGGLRNESTIDDKGRASCPFGRKARPSCGCAFLERAAMIDPACVALSLLPIHVWKDIGERLKGGSSPLAALDLVLA